MPTRVAADEADRRYSASPTPTPQTSRSPASTLITCHLSSNHPQHLPSAPPHHLITSPLLTTLSPSPSPPSSSSPASSVPPRDDQVEAIENLINPADPETPLPPYLVARPFHPRTSSPQLTPWSRPRRSARQSGGVTAHRCHVSSLHYSLLIHSVIVFFLTSTSLTSLLEYN